MPTLADRRRSSVLAGLTAPAAAVAGRRPSRVAALARSPPVAARAPSALSDGADDMDQDGDSRYIIVSNGEAVGGNVPRPSRQRRSVSYHTHPLDAYMSDASSSDSDNDEYSDSDSDEYSGSDSDDGLPHSVPDDPYWRDGTWPIEGLNGEVHSVCFSTVTGISVDGYGCRECKKYYPSRFCAYNRFVRRRLEATAVAGFNTQMSDFYDAVPTGANILGHCEFTYRDQLVTIALKKILINKKGGGAGKRKYNDIERRTFAIVNHACRIAHLRAGTAVVSDLSRPTRVYNVRNHGIPLPRMTDREFADYSRRENVRSRLASLAQRAI